MKKIVFVSILLVVIGLYTLPKLFLFNEDLVNFNFRHMSLYFPQNTVDISGKGKTLQRQINTDIMTEDQLTVLEDTQTMSLLISKNGLVVGEYYQDNKYKNQSYTSFSVVKSFVSILVGMALDDGLISDVHDPISDYVSVMKDSAYDGVSISSVLEMSSGVSFSEDYFDKSTDIYKIFNDLFLFFKPLNNQTVSYSGSGSTDFHYASIDTQALAMLVEAVTEKSLTENIEEKIWKPVGMTTKATWLTDLYGQEMAWWGFNATAEDFLKFGMMLSHKGNIDGQQIISEEWIEQATSKHNRKKVGDTDYFKYGYQFWLPEGVQNDFVAIGIWGQMIYIDPDADVVIVKFSHDSNFHANEPMLVEMFRAIVKKL